MSYPHPQLGYEIKVIREKFKIEVDRADYLGRYILRAYSRGGQVHQAEVPMDELARDGGHRLLMAAQRLHHMAMEDSVVSREEAMRPERQNLGRAKTQYASNWRQSPPWESDPYNGWRPTPGDFATQVKMDEVNTKNEAMTAYEVSERMKQSRRANRADGLDRADAFMMARRSGKASFTKAMQEKRGDPVDSHHAKIIQQWMNEAPTMKKPTLPIYEELKRRTEEWLAPARAKIQQWNPAWR